MKIQLHLLLAAASLAACTSIPTPKMLVASDTGKLQVQDLGKKQGAVADILTTTGEEHYFVIGPAPDGTLAGQRVDPRLAHVIPDQTVSDPFDSIAIVYYVEQPKGKHAAVAGYEDRRLIPHKPGYPKLAKPGSREKGLSCDALGVELARAEAVRWFARDQGAMGYTDEQAALRHVTNAAEYTGIAALVLIAAAAGIAPRFDSAPPPDPNRKLAAQIGEQNLRWSVTAADSRIIGLLKLRRGKGCTERPTLMPGNSDVQNLAALDRLQQQGAAGHLSAEARMHEQTRLLDELGPRPLPEEANRDCGVLFHCPVRWQSPPQRAGD